MQFEFGLKTARPPATDSLALAQGSIPLALVRNGRARRYVLRLQADGSARVTIPRGGTILEARQFAARHVAWLERALQRWRARPVPSRQWFVGMHVYFRGERWVIETAAEGRGIRFGSETLPGVDVTGDLRPAIESHLWALASHELPPRVLAHAGAHALTVGRVTIRNQRSRWGSCSRTGTISLNWRLIQVPPFVLDYVILHELMHLRQMNHSARYWREVERVCPDYVTAERWLKAHSALLR